MNRSLLSWIVAFSAFLVATVCNGAAFADRRVALVIGNSHYNLPSLTLPNPNNDADDVAATLRDLGFEVIQKNDTNKRELDLAMAQFARLATDADAALFFYAGHALQYQGRNYLVPTDAELEDEVSLRYQMMMIEDVRAALDRASGVKIMILDACRNSPVVDRLRKKIAGSTRNVENTRGLARIDKTQGMVVAYATAADDVAADGTGRNSPYTAALLKRLQEPGLEIEIMFRRIAADVNAQTSGRQRPETNISLLNEYYLNQKDQILWSQIKDSTDATVFRNFIERFPSSAKSFDARYRLDALEREAREVARAKQEQEARVKLAAERERTEREAAQRQETERARLSKIERERAEREAIAQRQEAERARLAKVEQERAEREAARLREEEQRTKLAMAEREAVQQREKAESVRRGLERESNLNAVPTTIPQQQDCKRDEESLARLRASQVRGEVIRFEKEMTCERLRPQVLRLRESLGVDKETEQAKAGPQPQPPNPEAPRPRAEREGAVNSGPNAMLSQVQRCKRDEEKLQRLRVSQVREDVIRFERELGCDKLRLQVLRLKESLGAN